MKKIAILGGLGRFGQVLYELFKSDFDQIVLYTRRIEGTAKFSYPKNVTVTDKISEIYEGDYPQTIFFSVPISKLEDVIINHKKFFKKNHLLVDVLSVKAHPKNIFEKHLRKGQQAILTHPMFGPDSVRVNKGFNNLPIVMDKFKAEGENYQFWKNYFKDKNLRIIELLAEQHDQMAAFSQGIAHFIGRILEDLNMGSTPIDTLGAKKLREIKEQTCNDTLELFKDLQQKNPFTNNMRVEFGHSYEKIHKMLLPVKKKGDTLVYGIQGGTGSFNEEAILHYIRKNKIKKYQIKYLYTTQKVLQELNEGKIDFGIFAMHNSVGGIVSESIYGIADYKFNIVEEIFIVVRHFLMKRKDAGGFDQIMAHPQVFKQCIDTLKERYSNIKLTSGKDDMIDTAVAAEKLAKGELEKNTAILGPKILSELYDLEVIDENLQDNKNNLTSFLLVSN